MARAQREKQKLSLKNLVSNNNLAQRQRDVLKKMLNRRSSDDDHRCKKRALNLLVENMREKRTDD